MSLASVKAAAQKAHQANQELREQALTTIADGVPIAAVARAADINRTTLHRWLKETKHPTPPTE